MRKTVVKEETIEVAVLRFGGRLQRVQLDKGATVQDAIEEAEFTVKPSDEVTHNGETLDKSELDEIEVSDADRIVLTPKFEGGVK